MHKAIEYEVKYDRNGRASERRFSVGPVVVTSILALVLALTGHTVWLDIAELLKSVK